MWRREEGGGEEGEKVVDGRKKAKERKTKAKAVTVKDAGTGRGNLYKQPTVTTISLIFFKFHSCCQEVK
jgi:hypothetical protein